MNIADGLFDYADCLEELTYSWISKTMKQVKRKNKDKTFEASKD